MPHVSTVKDSGLNLDSVCLRSSLSSTVVLPTPSAQSFLLYTELRWQYQSLSVWSLMFPLYATMENWEKYSDSSCTSSSLMSLGGNKRNPLWTPLLVSVQFSSVAQSCPTLCDPMNHSTPGLPIHHQLPEFTQTRVHWVSDPIQPSHPLLSPSPPALILSQHQGPQMSQLFASGGQSIGAAASTLILRNEHPGLISFRMDWLDLLAVQGTLKSLLQHHSSKASILQCSAIFIVQLSHPYMTAGMILGKCSNVALGQRVNCSH